MRKILIVAVLVVASACGGSKKDKAADKTMPTGGGAGSGTAVTPPTGGQTYGGEVKPPEGGGAPAGATLTAKQCQDLFQHYMDVVVKEHPEMKAQMDEAMQHKDEMVQQCQAQATQANYDCVMKGQTMDDLQKCQ